MQKQKGFTIIELLVVMGIIGILAVIGAPNFLIMQNGVEFRDDAQQFLDVLGEVRSNALSNKKCDDGSGTKEDSLKWSAYVKEGTGDTGVDVSVYCQWDDGTTDYLAALQNDNENNYTLDEVTDISYVGSETSGTYDADSGFLLISYLAGTGQAKIESFAGVPVLSSLGGTVQSDVRVTFSWPEGNDGVGEDISVCIDGIGGFVRRSSSATCPDK